MLQNSSLADFVTYFGLVFSSHQNEPRLGIVLSLHSLPHLGALLQSLLHRFFFFLHFFSAFRTHVSKEVVHSSLHSSRLRHDGADGFGGGGDDGDGGGGDGDGGGGDGDGGGGEGGGGDCSYFHVQNDPQRPPPQHGHPGHPLQPPVGTHEQHSQSSAVKPPIDHCELGLTDQPATDVRGGPVHIGRKGGTATSASVNEQGGLRSTMRAPSQNFQLSRSV